MYPRLPKAGLVTIARIFQTLLVAKPAIYQNVLKFVWACCPIQPFGLWVPWVRGLGDLNCLYQSSDPDLEPPSGLFLPPGSS